MSFDVAAVLAVLGLMLAVIAIRRVTPPRTADQRTFDRSNARLAILLGLWLVVYVAISGCLITFLRWDSAIAFATVGGVTLILAALTRFGPLWVHLEAVVLRSLLGETAAAAVYIGIGLAALGWGYRRHLALDAFGRGCTEQLATATDQHARVQVLAHEAPELSFGRASTPRLSCSRMVEMGRSHLPRKAGI